jgi:hypothetical protein
MLAAGVLNQLRSTVHLPGIAAVQSYLHVTRMWHARLGVEYCTSEYCWWLTLIRMLLTSNGVLLSRGGMAGQPRCSDVVHVVSGSQRLVMIQAWPGHCTSTAMPQRGYICLACYDPLSCGGVLSTTAAASCTAYASQVEEKG